jgi:hypothetical protein
MKRNIEYYREVLADLLEKKGKLMRVTSWTRRTSLDETPVWLYERQLHWVDDLPKQERDEYLVILMVLFYEQLLPQLARYWQRKDKTALDGLFMCVSVLGLCRDELPVDPALLTTYERQNDLAETPWPLAPVGSPEGRLVRQWLRRCGMLKQFDVFEDADGSFNKRDGRRVYVGLKESTHPKVPCLRDYAAKRK